MKRVALLSLIATAAVAAQAQTFVDRARVQSVEPQYETVQVPRNECTSQWVTEAQPVAAAPAGGYGGAIVGGVAGGLLGNQVGKGHGREAATAAGAVIGAIAGDRIANANAAPPQPQYVQREVRSCRTVNDPQNRLTGYRVTYEYHGQVYTTMTRQEPGRTLPVRVSVTPVDEREYDRPQR
ncbi:MAG TPA: glycine zipper 2TM domain-containing protein [Ramlibacter sp.]|nr:glycine zipper 2TM domain-containing protein [Ramlibacter sp.]